MLRPSSIASSTGCGESFVIRVRMWGRAMELDDLKLAWAQLERRVETTEALAFSDYKERKLDKSRRALRALGWGQALHCLLWIGLVEIVAPFWIEHRRVPTLLVAGLALHMYGVATICVVVTQLLLIARTYYTAPVVIFQRRLAELQRFRVISSLAIGLPWWILWVVATVVGAKRWLGVDLYAQSPGWIHVAIGIGVAGLALSLWAARRFAERPAQSPMLRRMVDDLAGRSLRRAIRQLDEIARFERD